MPAQTGSAAFVVVMLAACSASLHVGKLPMAIPTLREGFGLTLQDAALLVSLFQLAAMVIGVAGGTLADRFGPRRFSLLGLSLLALSSLAGALAPTAGLLLLTRGLESVGFIMTALSGPALVIRVVSPARRAALMPVWSAYMPTGVALGLLMSPVLLQLSGWRVWWAVCGLAPALAAWLVWRTIPADPRPVPSATGQSTIAGLLHAIARTVRLPGPWLLAVSMGLYAGQWLAVFSFLPSLFADAHWPPGQTAVLTALASLINVPGNILAGVLIQRGRSRMLVLCLGAVLLMVGSALLFRPELPMALRYLGVLVFSFGGGLIPGTIFASAPGMAASPSMVSTTTGLILQMSALGQFVVPWGIATLVTWAGGDWSAAFQGLAVLSVLIMLLAPWLSRQAVRGR